MRRFIDTVRALLEDTSLYEMANLGTATTGLPMTVFVSPRGGARHSARVKVSMQHGKTMNIRDTAVVQIDPVVLKHGHLDRHDRDVVFAWVALNRDVLIAYWNNDIETGELITRLLPV